MGCPVTQTPDGLLSLLSLHPCCPIERPELPWQASEPHFSSSGGALDGTVGPPGARSPTESRRAAYWETRSETEPSTRRGPELSPTAPDIPPVKFGYGHSPVSQCWGWGGCSLHGLASSRASPPPVGMGDMEQRGPGVPRGADALGCRRGGGSGLSLGKVMRDIWGDTKARCELSGSLLGSCGGNGLVGGRMGPIAISSQEAVGWDPGPMRGLWPH